MLQGSSELASFEQRIEPTLHYTVTFTEDAFNPANPALVDVLSRNERRRHRVAVVVDEGVVRARPTLLDEIFGYAQAHHTRMHVVAPALTITGGEGAKTERQLAALHRHLAALHIDRQSFVLAIGGGAALDVIGYAAATLHRGVRLIRMPSTVLAQNDAGVGVKNGINAFGVKNFLGTFAAPFAVVNDGALLSTLQPRDKVAGMAEAVKIALIRDREFFDWIDANAESLAAFDGEAVRILIRRCAQLHFEHIARGGDPFERHSARPLDFGHWAAHKLETLTDFELRHGEAVAIGIAIDSAYSVDAGHLDEHDFRAVIAVLQRLTLPVWHPRVHDPDLLDGIAEFREHLGGDLSVTLLRAPGDAFDADSLLPSILHRAILRVADANTAPT